MTTQTADQDQLSTQPQSGWVLTLSDTVLTGTAVFLLSLLRAASIYLQDGVLTVTDPDTLVRLARLRESLEQGRALYTLKDGNLGLGLSLHWSHFLEGMMAPFAILLKPVLGMEQALLAVAALFGPVMIALLAASVVWAVAPVVRCRRVCLGIAVLSAFSPPLMNYDFWGNADHHVLLVVLAIVSWGAALRLSLNPGFRQALVLGVSTAIGGWVSVECLVYTLLGFMCLGLLWLTEPCLALRRRLSVAIGWAVATLVVTVAVVLLMDPPEGGSLAVEIDRLSLPYACLLSAGLLIVAAMVATERQSTGIKLTALLVTAGCAGALWLWGFYDRMAILSRLSEPQLINNHWMEVFENQPLTDADGLIAWCGGGGVGLLLGLMVSWSRLANRLLTVGLLASGIGILGIGIVHLRFCTYAAGMGIVGFTLFLDWVYSAMVIAERWRRSVAALMLMTMMGVPYHAFATQFQKLNQSGNAGDNTVKPVVSRCDSTDFSILNGLEGQVVLTNINDSPTILFRHPGIKIVGALYHRGTAGLDANQNTWEAPPDLARQALSRLGIRWLLICPGHAPQFQGQATDRAMNLEGLTLGQLLESGTIPVWLNPATRYAGDKKPMLLEMKPETISQP